MPLLPEAPDYIEPLVGYRAWYFLDGELLLRSTQYKWKIWHPGKKESALCVCRVPGERASLRFSFFCDPWDKKVISQISEDKSTGFAGREHSCGIYAAKSKWCLNRWIDLVVSSRGNESGYIVFGEVNLWGNIAVHELGYRAQFAKIKTLYLARHYSYRRLPGYYKQVRAIAECYQVPLKTTYPSVDFTKRLSNPEVQMARLGFYPPEFVTVKQL